MFPKAKGSATVPVTGSNFCGMPIINGNNNEPLAVHPAFTRQMYLKIIGTSSVQMVGRQAFNSWVPVARAVSRSNHATFMKRLGLVTAALANAIAIFGTNTPNSSDGIFMGGEDGLGGFFHTCLFVPSCAAIVAGHRWTLGLYAVNPAANFEYTTVTNQISLVKTAGSSNIFLSYGGTAAQTPIDLGSNFHADGLSTDAYRFSIYCPPTMSNGFYYRVERLGTAFVAEGLITGTSGTQIPDPSISLSYRGMIANNGTGLAAGIDFGEAYTECTI